MVLEVVLLTLLAIVVVRLIPIMVAAVPVLALVFLLTVTADNPWNLAQVALGLLIAWGSCRLVRRVYDRMEQRQTEREKARKARALTVEEIMSWYPHY